MKYFNYLFFTGSLLLSHPIYAQEDIDFFAQKTFSIIKEMRDKAVIKKEAIHKNDKYYISYNGHNIELNIFGYPKFPLPYGENISLYYDIFPFLKNNWDVILNNDNGFYFINKKNGSMSSATKGCFIEYLPTEGLQENKIYNIEKRECKVNNNVPILSEIFSQSIIAGSYIDIQVKAIDKDNDPIIYSLDNVPDWITINPISGLITATPDISLSGIFNITVVVNDGKASASKKFDLTINPKLFTVTIQNVGNENSPDNMDIIIPYNGNYEYTINSNESNSIIGNINGCDGKIVKNKYVIENIKDNCTINQEFLNKKNIENSNLLELDIKIKPEDMNSINVDIEDIFFYKAKNVIDFKNVVFSRENDFIYIENKTPTIINNFILSYGDKDVIVNLNNELPGFSQAKIILPEEVANQTKLTYIYQDLYFLPRLIIGTAEDDPSVISCRPAPAKCNRPAFGSEREMMTTMAVRIHQELNRVGMYENYLDNMLKNCPTNHNYSECKNYPQRMNYSDKVYTEFGYYGHTIGWNIFGQQYTAEGWGGGGRANINSFISQSSGNIWLKDRYTMPSSPYYRPFSSGLYKTAIHETAHASGMSHWSGMTYGFGDFFGNFVEYDRTPEWRSTRPELKIPDIYLKKTMLSENRLRIDFLSTPEFKDNNFRLKITSDKPISYNIYYEDGNSFVVIDFLNQFFDKNTSTNTVAFIRGYSPDSPNSIISSLKISPLTFLHYNSVKYDVNDPFYYYTLLTKEKYKPTFKPYDVRVACENNYGVLLTELEYKTLYENLIENNKLNKSLLGKYISRDQKNGYVVSHYNEDSYDTSRVIYYNQIGKDMKAMCKIPKL